MIPDECTNPRKVYVRAGKYSRHTAIVWHPCRECAHCQANRPNDRKATNPHEGKNK